MNSSGAQSADAYCRAVIERLAAHGASLDMRAPSSNHTALHWAASKNRHAAVQLLVGLGADLEARDDSGWTALHAAAYWGAGTTARALLALGADVGVRDVDGDTPLHLAAYTGKNQVSAQSS